MPLDSLLARVVRVEQFLTRQVLFQQEKKAKLGAQEEAVVVLTLEQLEQTAQQATLWLRGLVPLDQVEQVVELVELVEV
jgi:hypothetical protein